MVNETPRKNIIRQGVYNTKDQPVPIKDTIIDKLDITEDDILELNDDVFHFPSTE